MTKALLRNTFREIGHTKARFISIMAIIALGVGFFAGIKATAPSMYNLAETYYRDTRLMDFRLVSTAGFAEEDIQAVAALDGVESVMPSYFCDAIINSEGGGEVVRLIAVPKKYEKNKALNNFSLTEGRTPRKSGEIVTESAAFAGSRHHVGETVTFNPIAGENKINDLLQTTSFTVVGKAESPLYISYPRGTTTVGDGKIDEYMYITAEDFKLPRYTELYVKADFSGEVSAFSDAYEKQAAEMQEKLRALADDREAAFTAEVIPNAQQELVDGKAEFQKKKAEAEEKLGEALEQLTAGEEEYNTAIGEAEQKLSDAQAQIDSGEAALAAGEEQYAAAIGAAEQLIADSSAQLAGGQQQLEEGRAALQQQLAAAKQSAADSPLGDVQTDVMDAIGSAQLGAAQSQLFAGSAQLAAGESELAVQRLTGSAQLQAARAQLSAAKKQLESGKAELEEKKTSGAQQLADARREYETAKADADKQLAEGEQKLKDGEAALEKLRGLKAEWYVFDRTGNPGYASFSQNADRLDAVASVFPLFFLLVAVLVCVTTMTRLIEEKRTEIATLKALGYGNGAIILKYVIYSSIAAVAGSAVGVAAGVASLPFIIYNAYKIMFYIGDITLVIHWPSVVLGTLAAILCTTVVSVIVCTKSLRAKPAQAMRPKAPKAGKRILLERMTPLWKHMGFTAKLTARNLFRYKVRLCMTVIGVAGCTALIVAAFGLLNSFVPLTDTQFGEVFRYDAVAVPNKAGTAQELAYLKDSAYQTGEADVAMLSLQEEATLSFGGKSTKENTHIAVPEQPDSMDAIITLRTRRDKTPLTLSDTGVLINERIAADFGFAAGDTVTLRTDNGEAQVKVDGIYEHYIHNYVFMKPALYEKLFGSEPHYNLLQVKMKNSGSDAESRFSTQMLSDDRLVAVTFMRENIEEFKNMLNSLDMVVVVMIVCAAALAFVVLYNLTNINLAERQREIATFKVLGFFNRETSRFIYIENIILTLLGIAAGLGLGVILSGFIIRTVEIDNVMFGRDIFFTTYLYAAGLTMLFSLLVNAAMAVKIRKVNMVESLKSVE